MSVPTITEDPMSNGDWAQAIIAGLAILAGFGGIIFQHHLEGRKARRDQKESLVSRRRELLNLVQAALYVAGRTRSELEEKSGVMSYAFYNECIVTVYARLLPYRDFARAFDVTTIADAALWAKWAYFRQILEVTSVHLDSEMQWIRGIANKGSVAGEEKFAELDTLLVRLIEAGEAILPLKPNANGKESRSILDH